MTHDRYVLTVVSGYRITATAGAGPKKTPPYAVSVLDTAYCDQVVESFSVHRNHQKRLHNLPMIAAKRLCDSLNEQERQWEREG